MLALIDGILFLAMLVFCLWWPDRFIRGETMAVDTVKLLSAALAVSIYAHLFWR